MKFRLSTIAAAATLICSTQTMASTATDKTSQEIFVTAIEQFNQNLNQPAESAFIKLSTDSVFQNQAYYYLSLIELRAGNRDKAKEYLAQAKTIAPDTANEFVLEGDLFCSQAQEASIFKALGLAKSCIAAYEKAIALEPDNTYALVAAIKFYLQAPTIAGGSDDDAAEKLQLLEKIDPNRADGLNAKRYLAQGKKQKAMQLLEQMSQRKEQTIEGSYTCARLYRDNKRYAQALAALTKLRTLEITPSTGFEERWMYMDSYLQEGEILLLQKQQLEKSVALLQEYNRQANNPADVHYFWGIWSLAKAYKATNDLNAYKREIERIRAQDYKQNKAFAKAFEQAMKREKI
jgi:hypothetical protein